MVHDLVEQGQHGHKYDEYGLPIAPCEQGVIWPTPGLLTGIFVRVWVALAVRDGLRRDLGRHRTP